MKRRGSPLREESSITLDRIWLLLKEKIKHATREEINPLSTRQKESLPKEKEASPSIVKKS